MDISINTGRMKINSISFNANKTQSNEYKDPLMKWPLRGTAFTSEVGEGLRPVIGSAATFFWIPVFLYIGADVYDKYKNDKDVYNPDPSRLIKQACFQTLASILLPVVAIKAGQKAFSLFGLGGKEKLTCDAQNKIVDLAHTFVANGNMRAYHNKDQECINKFNDVVKNNLEYPKNRNFVFKAVDKLQEILKINTHENIERYADKTIKNLINTRKSLLNPTEEFKKTAVFTDFSKALSRGETQSVATKSALIKMLKSGTLKNRMIKTLGGFIAVGFAINPIDKFVEHVIVEKYLSPKLDKFKKD